MNGGSGEGDGASTPEVEVEPERGHTNGSAGGSGDRSGEASPADGRASGSGAPPTERSSAPSIETSWQLPCAVAECSSPSEGQIEPLQRPQQISMNHVQLPPGSLNPQNSPAAESAVTIKCSEGSADGRTVLAVQEPRARPDPQTESPASLLDVPVPVDSASSVTTVTTVFSCDTVGHRRTTTRAAALLANLGASSPSLSPKPMSPNSAGSRSPARSEEEFYSRNRLCASTFGSSMSHTDIGGSVSPSWVTSWGPRTLRKTGDVSLMLGNVWDDYEKKEEVGAGSFGIVMLAKRKTDGADFAVKTVMHKTIMQFGSHLLSLERDIAEKLRHPNIVMLHTIYSDDDAEATHMVMEFCKGGDLFDRIAKRIVHSEDLVRTYLWQMASGIAYCHQNSICHRDLKPENYLLDTASGGASLKLIDFGLACRFEQGKPMTSMVGTIEYTAPEVFLHGEYTEKRDVWSMGIVMFMLSTLRTPYSTAQQSTLVWHISNCRLDMQWLDTRTYSSSLKKLICSMLNGSGLERPGAKELLRDPALSEDGSGPRWRCCPSWIFQ